MVQLLASAEATTKAHIPLLLVLLLAVATLFWLRTQRTNPGDAFRSLLQLRSHGLRRNHALEHATLHVLEERDRGRMLVGFAVSDGFRIAGQVEPLELLDAAHEALRRLQRGERRLAIHRSCGPSYLAAQVLAGLCALLFLLVSHRLTLLDLSLVVSCAILLAPILSRLLQRFATTSPDVQGITIECLSPLRQYLLANCAVSEFVVRIRPGVRRVSAPLTRFGRFTPAYARATVKNERR